MGDPNDALPSFKKKESAQAANQCLTILSIEVSSRGCRCAVLVLQYHTCIPSHYMPPPTSPPRRQIICETRGSLLPDPNHDRVVAVCYAVHDDMHYYASDKAGVEGENIVAERGVITLANRRGAWLGPVAPAAPAPGVAGAAGLSHGRGGDAAPAPYVSEFSRAFAGAGQGAARRGMPTPHAATGAAAAGAGSRADTGAGSGAGAGSAATAGPSVGELQVDGGQRTARQTLFGPRQENFIGLGRGVRVERAVTEAGLFQLVSQVMRRLDPDVVVGYEVQNSSLGYLLARGQVLGVRLGGVRAAFHRLTRVASLRLQISCAQDWSRVPQGRVDHRCVTRERGRVWYATTVPVASLTAVRCCRQARR